MKRNKLIAIFIATCIILQGCNKRMFPSAKSDFYPINKENITTLNGVYQNLDEEAVKLFDKSTEKYDYLWKQFNYLDENKDEGKDKTYRVQLQVKSENSILVTLWLNNKKMNEHLLIGKIKRGYFKTETARQSKGVPLIYYKSDKTCLYLATDKQGNLLLYRRGKSSLNMAILVAGSGYNQADLKYKRIHE